MYPILMKNGSQTILFTSEGVGIVVQGPNLGMVREDYIMSDFEPCTLETTSKERLIDFNSDYEDEDGYADDFAPDIECEYGDPECEDDWGMEICSECGHDI